MKRTHCLFTVLLALLLSVGTLPGVVVAEASSPDVMVKVQQDAVGGGYRLITTDDLWAMVSKEPAGVLLVDTRQDWEFAGGHIKGAVNFPLEPTWLARLTKRAELEQFIGPDKERHIVFY